MYIFAKSLSMEEMVQMAEDWAEELECHKRHEEDGTAARDIHKLLCHIAHLSTQLETLKSFEHDENIDLRYLDKKIRKVS